MRFGGHETFPVREGWLHKGLKLLEKDPEKLVHEHAADFLGVGRNMAKSIKHWLLATRIAETPSGQRITATTPMRITEIGQTIWKHDPYLLEPGTWWALHCNLVNNPSRAATWSWFFNHFHLDRFDKSLCTETLLRHLKMNNTRLPSRRTLDRDVACFLSTYARALPEQRLDPEESLECPFRELGLLTHYRGSGYYQLNQTKKPIPPHLLGYSISLAFEDARAGEGKTDVPLYDAAQRPKSPGRVFALTSESLFEFALRVEERLPGGEIEIAGHAGERFLRVQRKAPIEWVRSYYRCVKQGSFYAA